jgi:outer membrane protein
MNQRLVLSSLLAALCLPLLGMAQAPAAAPAGPAVITPAKIAWLNLEQAIFSCDDGKKEFAGVQQFVDQKNAQLEAQKKELDTLRNQLSIQGAKLTDDARADLEEQIETKDTNLQRFQQDTQKQIDSLRVKVTNTVGRKMLPVVEKIAKEKNLSAVVYINPQRDAYIDPALVITDEVIKAYNLANPVATPKAPAAAPAAAPKKP